MKFYVQSQLSMFSKIYRQRVRDFLINETRVEGDANEILSDKQVLPILNDARDKISK